MRLLSENMTAILAEETLRGEKASQLSARQVYFLTLMAFSDKSKAMEAYEERLAAHVFAGIKPDVLHAGEA